MQATKFKRVLLKISGEALGGKGKLGLDQDVLTNIASQIELIKEFDVEIGIVVGGGNFWRGRNSDSMDRSTSDHMGMLATTMNCLALQEALESKGINVRVQTAIEMRQIAEPYIRRRAVRHLEKGRIVIFGCGTGNPFFTTDTAAALRAAEIEADVLLLAKNVDGVYDSDPTQNINAKRFESLSYMDVLSNGLGVMDSTAITLCMDNSLPIIVFGIDRPDNVKRVLLGEQIGTIIN